MSIKPLKLSWFKLCRQSRNKDPNKEPLRKRQQRGSALMQVMMATGLLGLVSYGVSVVSSNAFRETQTLNTRQDFGIAQKYVASAVSSDVLCQNNFQIPGGFNRTQAISPDGIPVNVQTNLNTNLSTNLNGGLLLTEGTTIDDLNVNITELRFRAPDNQDCPPNLTGGLAQCIGHLYVGGNSTRDENISFSSGRRLNFQDSRPVAQMRLSFDNAGNFSGCTANASDQVLCQSMGGIYNPIDGSCRLGLRDFNCTNQFRANAQPPGNFQDWYVFDYTDNGQVLCASAAMSCPEGYYIASVNGNEPVCESFQCPPNTQLILVGDRVVCDTRDCFLPRETTWSEDGRVCRSTAGVTINHGGTGTLVSNTPAGSATVTCNNRTATMTGGFCGEAPLPPINGECGPAHGRSFANAGAVNSAGLCNQGAPNPETVAGNAPWNWTCSGVNGGDPSGTCTASAQAAPQPGGGPCNRIWSSTSMGPQIGLNIAYCTYNTDGSFADASTGLIMINPADNCCLMPSNPGSNGGCTGTNHICPAGP